MVMQHRPPVLTVEEARNLPPPSPEEIARRRRALEAMRVRLELERCQFLARGGVPLSGDEFMKVIGRSWDDDEWGADPASAPA